MSPICYQFILHARHFYSRICYAPFLLLKGTDLTFPPLYHFIFRSYISRTLNFALVLRPFVSYKISIHRNWKISLGKLFTTKKELFQGFCFSIFNIILMQIIDNSLEQKDNVPTQWNLECYSMPMQGFKKISIHFTFF